MTSTFAFGSSPAFSFGGSSGNVPAPAMTTTTTGFGSGGFGSGFGGGGSSGTTPAAPAPSSSFSFTSTTGAAPPASAPAPLFGSPAPSQPFFGAPTSQSLFGAPTPAPTSLFGAPTTSLFGSSAPLQTQQQQQQQSFGFGGGLSSPATAQPSNLFGGAPLGAQQQYQLQHPAPAMAMMTAISTRTPYRLLPEHYQKAIDRLHHVVQQHQRTMTHIESMAPAVLYCDSATTTGNGDDGDEDVDGSTTTTTTPSSTVSILQQQAQALQDDVSRLHDAAIVPLQKRCDQLQQQAQQLAIHCHVHGQWPIQALAARRGVRLLSRVSSLQEEKKDSVETDLVNSSGGGGGSGWNNPNTTNDANTNPTSSSSPGNNAVTAIHDHVQRQLRELLDRQVAYVDRLERMPSPYYWHALQQLERMAESAASGMSRLQQQLQRHHQLITMMKQYQQQQQHSMKTDNINDASLWMGVLLRDWIESQREALCRFALELATWQQMRLQPTLNRYHAWEGGPTAPNNVVWQHQQQQIKMAQSWQWHMQRDLLAAAAASSSSSSNMNAANATAASSEPFSSSLSMGGFGTTSSTTPLFGTTTTGMSFGGGGGGFSAIPSTTTTTSSTSKKKSGSSNSSTSRGGGRLRR